MVSLSLRPSATKDPTEDPLHSLIARINAQRGSFRNITEQGLEDEIRSGSPADRNDEVDDSSGKEDGQETSSRRDDIILARDVILGEASKAHMESAYALDFVSLLLSRFAPKQAELSISPYLKQHAPIGSLDVGVTQVPRPSDTEKRDVSLVATGWKLQSLNTAADSLLRSATRLEKEMRQEACFWEQILAVKDKGWPVCRLPRERHVLGVKYGFAEATSEFRDRGIAALRRGQDGVVDLDRGLQASAPKLLRVRLQHQGQIIESESTSTAAVYDPDSIERLLLRARDSIYDEELLHEMHREARTLVNQGVRCIDNTVHLPYDDCDYVIFDMIHIEDGNPGDLQEKSGGNSKATAILMAARLLLSHAHRHILRQRTQLPPPLTERKRPRPIYSILKPILAYLKYTTALTSLQCFLASFSTILAAANLSSRTTKIASSPFLRDLLKISDASKATKSPIHEVLGNLFMEPLSASMTLELPSRSTELEISLTTHLLPPIFGTRYTVDTKSAPWRSATLRAGQSMKFSLLAGTEDYILHLIMLDLVSLITSSQRDEKWSVESPHLGELRLSKKKGQSKWMKIETRRDYLKLEWGWIDSPSLDAKSYVWACGGLEKEASLMSLEEVVDMIGQDVKEEDLQPENAGNQVPSFDVVVPSVGL